MAWLGKVGIIMYIFSIALTFSGYYVDQVFATNLFSSVTEDSLQAMIAKYNVAGEQVTAELIFGDFITGIRVLFGIVTGSSITTALHLLPNFSNSWDIIVGLLFGLSTSFLWLNILTGRDL